MASARRRIIALSHPVPMCGCWLFCGSINYLGYGQFSLTKKISTTAHRASYRAFKGQVPDGLDVLHRCDVRCCVNPDHLFVGTHIENMQDMIKKGRAVFLRGTEHGNAVLDEEIVRHIRSSPIGCTTLARHLGISKTTVKDVRTGRTWGHVT